MHPYSSMTPRSDPHVAIAEGSFYSAACSPSERSETVTSIARSNLFQFEEPSDSHFTTEDILRIGNRCIGLRPAPLLGRVTRALLNISFCKNESVMETEDALFAELDKKISRGKDCTDLIRDYETAITSYIRDSLSMSANIILPETYASLLDSVTSVQFQVIAPSYMACTDPTNRAYAGLGRFPPEFVPDDPVTIINKIPTEELGLTVDELENEFSEPNEAFGFTRYLAAHYRRALLGYLRSDRFDPQDSGYMINTAKKLSNIL